jgi:tetratricopeptide (TPR) repeat protein
VPVQVWAGEVFALSHRLTVPSTVFHSVSSGLKWSPGPLVVEAWSESGKVAAAPGSPSAGESVGEFILRTRAMAGLPGILELEPATQDVTLKTGTSRFGNYVRPNLQGFTVGTAPVRLQVAALPALPPDAGTFTGAVGHFTLVSRITPESVAVGQTVTWTVVLSGTGNWPALKDLPPRTIPPHFRTIKALRTVQVKAPGRFDGSLTEDLLLIPEQKGRATLGAIRWAYFDPQLGRYVTLSAAPVALAVAPAERSAEAKGDATWQLQGAETPLPAGGAAAPVLPPPTLRDPIPGTGDAPLPYAASRLEQMALWPTAAIVPFWLALAWWRMRRRDAQRPRREARQQALGALAELDRVDDPRQRGVLIERWQQAAATVWAFRQAAPSPAAFGDAAEWRRLWREANRARFSSDPSLPGDWIARARAATQAQRVPAPAPWKVLQPAHLLPVLALTGVLAAQAAQTPDAIALYRAGNFAGAETAWREVLGHRPRDWRTHHNLALALAQQGRLGEAAAQAATAFAQCPSDPVVRWDLGVLWGRARFGTREISACLGAGPFARVARWSSPAQWQRGLILGAWLTVVGLLGIVASVFADLPRRWRAAGGAVLIAGLAGTLVSGLALREFGELGRPDAAMVWRETALRSVPTDVGGPQDASSLAAGTLVRLDDSFLGWRHLALANGQTGWLRSDTLVPLWQ